MIEKHKLSDMIQEIEGYAREYGLDFFPVIFEMLDFEQINMVASYGGFPSRYPHWRFGMQYEYMDKSYGYGLHKIYEMVINHNPCYAYLLDSNKLVDQKLVIGHVYAHCDFFKNNAYFAETNRKMIDEMANHGIRIQNYMAQYGQEEVENFIDVCTSIENLIDANALFSSGIGSTNDQEDERVDTVMKLKSKSYMDSYINPPEYMEARRQEIAENARERNARFPKEPVTDLLLFLIEHSPIANWKRDILSMIREESYYFAPQAQTKIMNEGWASYWHEKIMTQKALRPSELVDFADHHSSTLATQPGQLNPYKLGYELFHDIERRWNRGQFGREYEECDDIQQKAQWNTDVALGREKIFEVRAVYNDMMFIDEFLTDEFCREQKLFTYAVNDRSGNYEIQSRGIDQIKEQILFSLTNMGHPYVTVIDANYDNRGELYLKHRFDGVELRRDYAQATLENIYRIWSRPVHIESVVEDDVVLLSFDGNAHRDRKLTESSAA